MKSLKICIILMVVVLAAGCGLDTKSNPPSTFTSAVVRTSYNSSCKLPAGAKYAFVQFASDTQEDSEWTMIDQRLKTALSAELKKKGYKAGEYEGIDFFVVYAVDIQQQIDILIAKSEVQGNEWIAAVAAPNDYVHGALVVQMIDAKSMQPVWVGVFNAEVELKSVSEKEKQQRVGYAVRELLKSFPPQ